MFQYVREVPVWVFAGPRASPVAEDILKAKGVEVFRVDGKDGRAIGRSGLGAVMGSKNLKAVVVRGTRTFPIADEPGLNQYLKDLRKEAQAQAPRQSRGRPTP